CSSRDSNSIKDSLPMTTGANIPNLFVRCPRMVNTGEDLLARAPREPNDDSRGSNLNNLSDEHTVFGRGATASTNRL
ncbi:hypothetical protein ElyMa_003212600, partial [Elysia marginata]